MTLAYAAYRRMYPLNTSKKIARRMSIIIPTMIISQGIPLWCFLPGARHISAYPVPVAVTPLLLPYRIPTEGVGFFCQEVRPAH